MRHTHTHMHTHACTAHTRLTVGKWVRAEPRLGSHSPLSRSDRACPLFCHRAACNVQRATCIVQPRPLVLIPRLSRKRTKQMRTHKRAISNGQWAKQKHTRHNGNQTRARHAIPDPHTEREGEGEGRAGSLSGSDLSGDRLVLLAQLIHSR